MRWGVPDVSQIDHLGPQICYDEVEHCKAVSLGPPFITLLGQRYGDFEIPFNISLSEMQLISKTATNNPQIPKECTEALHAWYALDENCAVPTYQLKPVVEAHLTLDDQLVSEAKKKWQTGEKGLRNLFSMAIPILIENGEITREKAKRYACSVTEHEIINGILNASEHIRRRIPAFIRTVTDLERVQEHPKAHSFLDMFLEPERRIDESRFELINDMRDITLAAVLKESNIRTYEVPWEAIANDGVERSVYLRKFCMEFENKTISLIDKTIAEMSSFENDDLYVETLQHLNACKVHVKHFHGRDYVIHAVRDYITGPSRDPFLIYGYSGSGKTSIIAKVASMARGWLPDLEPQSSVKASVVTQSRRSSRLLNLGLLESKATKSRRGLFRTQEPPTQSYVNPQDTAMVIVRFLGTSPGTSTLRQTIKYMCRQLATSIAGLAEEKIVEIAEDMDPEAIRTMDDFQQVVNTFYSLLRCYSNMGRWVVIFLDAIDQLDPADGAYNLSWLRSPLPNNVRLIISTLPEVGGILDAFRVMYPEGPAKRKLSGNAGFKEEPAAGEEDDQSQCENSEKVANTKHSFEVSALESTMCEKVLESRLSDRNRVLQPFQWRLVRRAFDRCRLTIFVVLVDRVVSQWRSWHVPKSVKDNPERQLKLNPICTDAEAQEAIQEWPILELALNERDAIRKLFDSLERSHGKVFTSHALAYITASRNGLSEAEIVDLLSLDDDVLRDVFQHHLPPQIRAPPFVWARLRSSIGGNLVEREVDGIGVIFWYHRQFIEAAQEYYLSDWNFKQKIHSTMADYFLGTWAGKKKYFQYPKYLVKKLALSEASYEDRAVPPQPYVFEEKMPNSKAVRLNLRKLNELPWHLISSGRIDDFYTEIVFNYEFLVNKLKGTSRSQLLADLNLPDELYENYLETVQCNTTDATNKLPEEERSVRRGGFKMSFVPTAAEDLARFQPKPPIPELHLVYNSIRIAALSLDADPNCLTVDLLGRLSKIPVHNRISSANLITRNTLYTFSGVLPSTRHISQSRGLVKKNLATSLKTEQSVARDYIKELLQQCRLMGRNHCAILPRSLCFDSGSGLLHTTFDLGMGLSCLMTNRLILSIPLGGGTLTWYDLSGHPLKSMPHAAANLFSVKSLIRKHKPNPVSVTLIPIKFGSTVQDNSRPTEEGEENIDDNASEKEEVRLLQLAEVDFFTGRVTELCNLDKDWSAWFSMNNVNMLMGDWIASMIDQCLYLAHWRSHQLIVTNQTTINRVFWYSDVHQMLGFVLSSGAFVIDTLKHRIAKLPTPQDISLISLAIMADNNVICCTKQNMLKSEMLIFEPDVELDSELSESENWTQDGIINIIDLRIWKFRMNRSVTVLHPSGFRMQQMTSHLSYDGQMMACLFQTRRKQATGFGIVWHHKMGHLVELNLPNSGDENEQTEEQMAICKSIIKYTNGYGRDVAVVFSRENDLLLTSGTECLLLVWSTNTGHLLRVVSQGGAEGIICGVAPNNSNKNTCTLAMGSENGSMLVVCHFPDQSALQYGDSPDQSIFVMGKVYHMDALRKPSKEFATMGSMLFSENEAMESVSNQMITATGEPLTFQPAYISTEYIAEDALPTMVLASYKKEARFEADSLVLYDLDEDCQTPICCWSTGNVNAKNINSFFSSEPVGEWPSYNKTQLAFIHTTVTHVKVFTVFYKLDRPESSSSVATHVFLDPTYLDLYMPNLYCITANGPIRNFGLLNSEYGFLVLVRAHSLSNSKLLLDIQISDPEFGLRSLWDGEPQVIDLVPAMKLISKAGHFVLDQRELQTPILRQISNRPNHPSQLVIGLSESHQSMHPVTRSDGRAVVWLGAVIIVELGYPKIHPTVSSTNCPVVLKTVLLDHGPQLLILPDGDTVISYRLAKYNIESGLRTREYEASEIDKQLYKIATGFHRDNRATSSTSNSSYSDDEVDGSNVLKVPEVTITNSIQFTEEQVYLQDLQLMCSGALIVGKQHQPEQQIFLDFDASFSDSDDEDYGASPARCLLAYATSDLRKVASYKFENEPYMVWTNDQTNTIITVTPNEYIRGFELSSEKMDRKRLGLLERIEIQQEADDTNEATENEKSPLGRSHEPTETEEMLELLGYLEATGLSEILQRALLEVADRRSLDPIQMLAESIRRQWEQQP
ncbi:hypothetical protein PHET_02801 [Paragonimus heterotremus]|uniref:NWD1/2-like winged helix-turn-helix domain-containing protein n=1 Tax=Paragonimus heterotremus TaxID=100268 RepID=A0A8J4SQ91_9TREM|nr:hypothetical protein PHET_02801 [Paragonimus heterotremus]